MTKRLPDRPRKCEGVGHTRSLRWWGVLAAVVVAGVLVVARVGWISRRTADSAPIASNAPSEPRVIPKSGDGTRLSVVALRRAEHRKDRSEQLSSKSDATADDWESEVWADRVSRQFVRLASMFEHSSSPALTSDELEGLIDTTFRCASLLPDKFDALQVPSPLTAKIGRRDANREETWHGVDGARAIFMQLRESLAVDGAAHVKFKVYQLEHIEDAASADQDDGRVRLRTNCYYEAHARGDQLSREQTAVWQCEWLAPLGDASNEPMPRLTRITLLSFQESQLDLPGGRLFDDVTATVLGDNDSYAAQIVPGIPFWLSRLGREFLGQFGHHGIAVGDVNGDQLDDLYVCDAGGLPNRLYVQQPNATARDVSEESGVNLLEDSLGALLVDLDNDGDQDLVVVTDPWIQFAENDGQGHFKLRTPFHAETDGYSLAAADFDNDSLIDIYVCGYNARRQDPLHRGLPFPLPYHDAENGGRNYLLRNDGAFVFRDVTADVGLDENNSRFSFAAAWEDFDNDGDLDLYVANDFGRNNLYRNDGGRFSDVAASAGVEDQASGMSVSWADYDRDGRMDLYIGNMFSAAGNRVTYQRQFGDGLQRDTVDHLQRMARGNTLFHNVGQGRFDDESQQADVTLGRWAWASRFVDLNNDGWQDLVIANGYVTGEDTSDL